MVDMKMDKKQAEKYSGPSLAKDSPEYPYGLQLTLDDAAMEKLGIKKLPEVGASMTLVASVEVCGASEYRSMDNESRKSVTLQITKMELSAEGETKEIYDT